MTQRVTRQGVRDLGSSRRRSDRLEVLEAVSAAQDTIERDERAVALTAIREGRCALLVRGGVRVLVTDAEDLER